MGQITIKTEGSFGRSEHQESALEGGHAAAIGRAILYLTRLLPEAIEDDHKLHAKGQVPPNAPFGREGQDSG